MVELNQEIWHPVPLADFAATYSVSNMGRFRSNGFFYIDKEGKRCNRPPKILKPRHRQGYYKVALTFNKKKYYFQAHQLIARVFIPNPEGKPFINHIDGNGLNNHLSNLEWCTQSENMHHAHYVLGKRANENKPIKQLTLSGELVKVWEGIHAAKRGLNLGCNTGIFDVLKGKRKTCKGFKWEYV